MARHILHYAGAVIFTLIFTIVVVEPLATPHKYPKKDTWTVEDSKATPLTGYPIGAINRCLALVNCGVRNQHGIPTHTIK